MTDPAHDNYPHVEGPPPLPDAEVAEMLDLLPTIEYLDLLDAVTDWLNRFIVFPNEHGATAVALWIAATHAMAHFDVAPYLLITAPEIESGKTRVMEVAASVAHRPMFSSSMTPAVLYRSLDKDHPTLFLDEADNIWTGRKDDKASELVALLNAGHRRGVPALRMGGPRGTKLETFDVFGPKVLAGAFPNIGNIPEALRSRSIHLRMQRKLGSEEVTRWTRQVRQANRGHVEGLRDRLSAAFGNPDNGLNTSQIEPLDELTDRDFDVWEPLLAVAHLAGGHWPRMALEAALALCGADPTQAVPARMQAVLDTEEVWNGESFMLTEELLDRLHRMPERMWGNYYGRPLTPHRLGGWLASYSVESKFSPHRDRRKGYYLEDISDLWARYGGSPPVPPPVSSPTSSTSPAAVETLNSESLGSFENLPEGVRERQPRQIEMSADHVPTRSERRFRS